MTFTPQDKKLKKNLHKHKIELNEKLKSHLLIISYLIVGFILIGAVQQVQMPDWPNTAFILLSLFVIVNLLTLKNLPTE